jgi:glucose/arabinose dehydrogenase
VIARFAARPVRLLAMLALAGVAVTGCANFSGQDAQAAPTTWSAEPTLTPENAPEPSMPGSGGSSQNNGGNSGGSSTAVPPPQGCTDYNPAVIATCLDTVDAVAALPSSPTDPVVLAAERSTGRILKVQKGKPATVLATLSVDTTGGGGLTGLALSPSYTSDQLIFAYITTPTDNRVVRIAPGDTPKPILTGIPRGATDNRGVLALDHTGALLVATGDAGNPANSANPASLAGKVLRIDVDGTPAQGDPTPNSSVLASGLVNPGGLCSSLDGTKTWVTDDAGTADLLYRFQLNQTQTLSQAAWSWPDKPGVAGCAAFSSSVLVSTSTAGNVQSLALNSDGSFSGTPQVALAGNQGFGRLSGMDILSDSSALAGTVNKAGGTPVSSDDRVVLISGASALPPGRD